MTQYRITGNPITWDTYQIGSNPELMISYWFSADEEFCSFNLEILFLEM